MKRSARVLALVLTAGWAAGPLSAQNTFEDHVANLKSPNADTREKAAEHLGKSRRQDAVTPLAAMVRDPDNDVRRAVVKALKQLRDLSALPALVTSMRDGDPEIRRLALEGILEVYLEPELVQPGFPDVFAEEFDSGPAETFAPVEPGVFEAVRVTLRDEDDEVRELSAHAVGILGAEGLSGELLPSLQDPDARVRAVAATSLARVGTSEEGASLIPLLSDEAPRVRMRALHALGVLEVKQAAPALRAVYESYGRREEAVPVLITLSRLKATELGQFFLDQLADASLARRRLAIEGLARISDPGVIDGFKKDFQRARNEEIRMALAFALAYLGDSAFVDTIAINLGGIGLKVRARSYLVELGPSRLSALYPYLADPDPHVRAELCRILAELGDPAAIARLEPLVQDSNAMVADSANRAIERLRAVERAGSDG
jgi:HEAT repeat protein